MWASSFIVFAVSLLNSANNIKKEIDFTTCHLGCSLDDIYQPEDYIYMAGVPVLISSTADDVNAFIKHPW